MPTEALATTENSPPNLGDMINALYGIRERRKELSAEDKELIAQAAELEAAIIANMDTQGTTLSRSSTATVSISEQEIPNVEDWDVFLEHIKENDQLYLLQRRLSTSAVNELLTMGEALPSVNIFTKRTLNVRKVS